MTLKPSTPPPQNPFLILPRGIFAIPCLVAEKINGIYKLKGKENDPCLYFCFKVLFLCLDNEKTKKLKALCLMGYYLSKSLWFFLFLLLFIVTVLTFQRWKTHLDYYQVGRVNLSECREVERGKMVFRVFGVVLG